MTANLNNKCKFIAYLIIPLLVIVGTIFRGTYHLDPHHWGLMLGNAKDLYEGKIPYKEIFIQYGFLTTLLQALGYSIGKNLLVLVASAAIAYAVGIAFIFKLGSSVLKSDVAATYVVIAIYLLHPMAIFPWSNYIAFPFLVYGLSVLILFRQNNRKLIFGGLSLGLAILAREGLAPAIILASLSAFFVDLYISRSRFSEVCHYMARFAIGMIAPIMLFFAYLASQGLIDYWRILSIGLPAIYATETFSHVAGFALFDKVFAAMAGGYLNLDFRWILISLIIFVNAYLSILTFFKNRPEYLTDQITKISFFSLIFLSSTLHIAEIFRFSTASVIGLISFFSFLQFYKLIKIIFIPMLLVLTATIFYGNSGLYYYPSLQDIQNGSRIHGNEIFYGQKFAAEKFEYYGKVEEVFKKIANLKSCEIKYLINNTPDSLMPLLSPFRPLQFAPFETSESVANLRPDIVIQQKSKLFEAKEVAILFFVPRNAAFQMQHPGSYSLYAAIPAPNVVHNLDNYELAIFLPLACFRSVK